jgi:hypothetical protein
MHKYFNGNKDMMHNTIGDELVGVVVNLLYSICLVVMNNTIFQLSNWYDAQ